MHKNRLTLLILSIFVVILIAKYHREPAYDLTSSYLGSRLFVMGQTSHLYSQDSRSFNKVFDPVWKEALVGRGLNEDFYYPPYVQTPLWGYLLQPLTRVTSFPAFKTVFLVIISLCLAGVIWLTARYWTTNLFNPLGMFLVCAGCLGLYTLRYSMELMQTHIIFLFLAVLAVVWARTGKPVLAGVVLALAAAVKITPGLILIYWLFTRQRKAAISFVISSVALLTITIALTGIGLVKDYFASMSRISHILLVAWNNQSLASWWLGRSFSKVEIYDWHSFPLPASVKFVSLALLVASAVAGGWLDRRLMTARPDAPPYGAVFTMIGATVFTPIAWSHYYILLIVPLMLLIDETVRRRSYEFAVAAIGILLLTEYPLLPHQSRLLHLHFAHEMRTQFYAGILAMACLMLLHLRRMQQAKSLPSSEFGEVEYPHAHLAFADGSTPIPDRAA